MSQARSRIINNKSFGQSTLLAVLCLSVVATGIAYYTLDRTRLARKTVVLQSQRQRAMQALETGVETLHRIYSDDSSCDPGLFLASSLLAPKDFTGAAPGTFTGQGVKVSLPAQNNVVEDYIVQIGPIYTLERTDIADATLSQSWRKILTNDWFFLSSTASFRRVGLGSGGTTSVARSPSVKVDSTGYPGLPYDHGNPAAPAPLRVPLGPRDLSIELMVSYPPVNPHHSIRQSIVFHNTCASVSQLDPNSLGNFFPIPSDFLGIGPTNRRCDTRADPHNLGVLYNGPGAAVTQLHIHALSIEVLRYYLQSGIRSGTLSAGATGSADELAFLNCADVNRDGLVTELDLGLLEKLMSGYIYFIPPIFPDYRDGTDSNHKLAPDP